MYYSFVFVYVLPEVIGHQWNSPWQEQLQIPLFRSPLINCFTARKRHLPCSSQIMVFPTFFISHQSSVIDDRSRIVGSTLLSSPHVRQLGDKFGTLNRLQAGNREPPVIFPPEANVSVSPNVSRQAMAPTQSPTERTKWTISAGAKAAGV